MRACVKVKNRGGYWGYQDIRIMGYWEKRERSLLQFLIDLTPARQSYLLLLCFNWGGIEKRDKSIRSYAGGTR